METKKVEQVKMLIQQFIDSDDLPADKREKETQKLTEEMRKLTGFDRTEEELDREIFDKWDHPLEICAYFMIHDYYPPGHDVDFVFWKYKPEVDTDNNILTTHYYFDESHSVERGSKKDHQLFTKQYLLSREGSTDLEALPLQDIIKRIKERFPNWTQIQPSEDESDDCGWCFRCQKQETYWMNSEFWIFQYGRTTDSQKDYQIIEFCCHNMSNEQIKPILECMKEFQCSLHLQKEEHWKAQDDWW